MTPAPPCRVNAVRPGAIDTEIDASGRLPDRAKQVVPVVPMAARQRCTTSPAGASRSDRI